MSILAIFQDWVRTAPKAVALEYEREVISYAELDARSTHFARQLACAGVREGDIVGISSCRSASMVVGLLGILKAGAAYFPLNPAEPPVRLRAVLESASPAALVFHGRHDGLAVPFAGPVLQVENVDDFGRTAGEVCLPEVQEGHLAYVCTTSGSTGHPKGVMIPHRGVTRLVKNTNYIDISVDDIFLQLAPLSFDASTFEIWGALLNGAKLVIYPPDQPELRELARCIKEKSITTLWLTSALFNLMVDCECESLLGVRQLLAGGDVLSVTHARKLLARMPEGHVLINGYGPTENTTFTCCHRMSRSTSLGERIPIGVPVTGTDVVIVEENASYAPTGATGEIFIGGLGLAIGYLNNPDLDAQKFVHFDGKRFYRSGDLGAWNPDGTIDFRGRVDDQVKIRGFRIELGEVEAALRSLAGVRDAAVVLCEAKNGEKQLAAFVVCEAASVRSALSIKAQLADRLPAYMIPSECHFLAALPVAVTGKLDRHALVRSLVDSPRQPSSQRKVEPLLGPLERQLSAIWSRLFNRSSIGRDENFFDLGGNSLLAAQFVDEAAKLLPHRLHIADLFRAQTIGALARKLERDASMADLTSLVPLRSEGTRKPLFLVHGMTGDVYAFLHLARAMKPERPILGVQAVGLDGRHPCHESMEQMAAYYAKQIRSFQPEGPYHLAGFSLGGWIAYAVAQELRKGGVEVGFLGILDTKASADVPWYYYWQSMGPDLLNRMGRQLRAMRETGWSDRVVRLKRPVRTMCYLLARSQRRVSVDRSALKGWDADHWNLLHARYQPPPYHGRAEVFVAADGKWFPYFFWKRRVRGGVRFHHVPGLHMQILMPENCRVLADLIDTALESHEALK